MCVLLVYHIDFQKLHYVVDQTTRSANDYFTQPTLPPPQFSCIEEEGQDGQEVQGAQAISADRDNRRVLLQLLDSHSGSEEREWSVSMASKCVVLIQTCAHVFIY